SVRPCVRASVRPCVRVSVCPVHYAHLGAVRECFAPAHAATPVFGGRPQVQLDLPLTHSSYASPAGSAKVAGLLLPWTYRGSGAGRFTATHPRGMCDLCRHVKPVLISTTRPISERKAITQPGTRSDLGETRSTGPGMTTRRRSYTRSAARPILAPTRTPTGSIRPKITRPAMLISVGPRPASSMISTLLIAHSLLVEGIERADYFVDSASSNRRARTPARLQVPPRRTYRGRAPGSPHGPSSRPVRPRAGRVRAGA